MSEQVKVLVVDDEEIVLRSVCKALRDDDEHEFIVDTVLSPREGLALMNRWKYDVIVTDLMMPGIDGLELIDRIHQTDNEARIVMITGYATMRTALQALRKGAFDYIAKPFTKEELRTVVTKAARAKPVPEAATRGTATGPAADGQGQYHTFLNETYACVRTDGTMCFGVETAFLSTIGRPLSIELSKIGETVSQGNPFGAITNADMRVFNLRAPLSGRVLETNQEAVDNVNLIQEDPRGKGWLLEVEPTDFREEVENLEA